MLAEYHVREVLHLLLYYYYYLLYFCWPWNPSQALFFFFFKFLFAFITSGRVNPIFQMWTSYDLRCAFARRDIPTLSNPHSCPCQWGPWERADCRLCGALVTILTKVPGDLLIHQRTFSHATSPTLDTSLPWLKYLRKNDPAPKQTLVSGEFSLHGP